MRRLLLLSFSISIITVLFSCKKEKGETFLISGRILESSSNPVPVRYYKLHLQQRDSRGFLGEINGVSKHFKTDKDGYFRVAYTLEEGTGFYFGTNSHPLSIEGTDQDQFKGLEPWWYPIPSHKDTSLNTVFLYKKINVFVRKLQFDKALPAGDSLEVLSPTTYNINRKKIYGPIAIGTIIADTIKPYILTRIDMETQRYYSSSVLMKPGFRETFLLDLPKEDEAFREQLVIYRL